MRLHTDQRARNLEVLDREERKLDEAALRYERAKATVDFLLLDEDAPEWLLDAAERIEDDRYDELQAQTYFTEQCRGWVHKEAEAIVAFQGERERMRRIYERGTETIRIPI